MEEGRESLWDDSESGEIHVRDKWQFELKSDFFLPTQADRTLYTQEFYLFIPNSLQVNANTYSKAQFYLDQTTLIRYKTPEFTFYQLLESPGNRSPFKRLHSLFDKELTSTSKQEASIELKLLANIVRSTVRHDCKDLIEQLNDPAYNEHLEEIKKGIYTLYDQIALLKLNYEDLKDHFSKTWNIAVLKQEMHYINEFMNNAITYYLTLLLEQVRSKNLAELADINRLLSQAIIQESPLPDTIFHKRTADKEQVIDVKENYVYRTSLLSKFILDPLQLLTNRFSVDQRYQHWIGSISAGIAMSLYFSLFVSLGNVFIINSAPFVLLTVIIYVLKDRIKEWLKNYSYQRASRWFSDYTTKIMSFNRKKDLGTIKDFFSFLTSDQLSDKLKELRALDFHKVLEHYQRLENIIFYKRVIEINSPRSETARKTGLNIIFRLDIHQFLNKASDAIETLTAINPKTGRIEKVLMPKVYHLNLILRNTKIIQGKEPKIEHKKFRIVVDKNGIKRIQRI